MRGLSAALALGLLVIAAQAEDAGLTGIDIRRLPKPLMEVLKLTPDCSPLDNVIMERSGITRISLPDGATLYRVPCWSNDNNTVERYFIIDQGVAVPLLFAIYNDGSGWSGTAEMLSSRFDPTNLELSTQGRADTSGHCGTAGRWRWKDGGFRLVELRYAPGCDSGSADDPAQWPTIFKARDE
jgi:hypothetical protein